MPAHGELKEWGRRFIRDVINAHDLSALDDYIADDIHIHDTVAELPNGIEGLRSQLSELWEAFPDIRAHVDLEIVEEPLLVMKLTQHGTHTGSFRGLEPTGREFQYQEVHIIKVINGKCVEHWAVINSMHLMQQLGQVPDHLPRPVHRDLENVVAG